MARSQTPRAESVSLLGSEIPETERHTYKHLHLFICSKVQ